MSFVPVLTNKMFNLNLIFMKNKQPYQLLLFTGDIFLDSIRYEKHPTPDEVFTTMIHSCASVGQLYHDRLDNEEYDDLCFEYDLTKLQSVSSFSKKPN